MKLVKEYIVFEKFTEDGDPIQDLGIGLPFARIKRGDIIKTNANNFFVNHNPSGIISKRPYIFTFNCKKINTDFTPLLLPLIGVIIQRKTNGYNLTLKVGFFSIIEQAQHYKNELIKKNFKIDKIEINGVATLTFKEWSDNFEILKV